MKNIKIIFSVISLLIIALYSCDEVEPPYIVENSEVETSDTLFPELPDNPERIVLLEKFTGHLCPNCPLASHIIHHELMPSYGDQLAIVSIHTSWFGRPEEPVYGDDFRDSLGLQIEEHFEYISRPNPNAMINRVSKNNSDANTWESEILPYLTESPELYLQIVNQYNDTTSTLKTNVKTTFFKDAEKDIFLALYLVEDSVVAPQKNSVEDIGLPIGDVKDYVHNHIMRGCINTPASFWGSQIAEAGTVAKDSAIVKAYEYSFHGEYVPRNCKVVAFAYDNETKLVLQAAKKAVDN